MTTEGTKEEIKLHIEIFKFVLIALLATAGGMITLLNIEKQNHVQHVLLALGWVLIGLLLVGISVLIVYIYSLLRKI